MEEAQVHPEDLHMEYFLMAMHHLKRYPTELEHEPLFDVDCRKGRDWVWFYIEKLQQLKGVKIIWPADNCESDIWILTVDRTHCWIPEPTHEIWWEIWSQDKSYFSHKSGRAGINYEIGISIFGNLIWMNGPFKAGDSDNRILKGVD
jgi:hypothetical protein